MQKQNNTTVGIRLEDYCDWTRLTRWVKQFPLTLEQIQLLVRRFVLKKLKNVDFEYMTRTMKQQLIHDFMFGKYSQLVQACRTCKTIDYRKKWEIATKELYE